MANMNIKSNDNTAIASPEADYDRSPTIYLNDDQCEALGIKGQPVPGTVYELKVRAVVARVIVSEEESDETKTEGNKPDVDVTFRLEDIEIVSDGGKSTANMLYSN